MHDELSIRVRYNECDPMGLAHHAVYPVWFEMGRTELLRSCDGCYRSLEEQGLFLVVSELTVKYQAPARYDDELTLTTILHEVTRVRLRHTYQLSRSSTLIATASTVLACVNKQGTVQAIPSDISCMDSSFTS